MVEKILVAEKNIGYCIACYYCKDNKGVCIKNDDMSEILEKIIQADVLVLASPVYFYSMDAQLKALIDRSVARWLEIKDKEFYYIATAAEDSETVMDGTLACMRGFADCLEGSKECGVILGKGVYEAGIIKNKPIMNEAF